MATAPLFLLALSPVTFGVGDLNTFRFAFLELFLQMKKHIVEVNLYFYNQ